MVAVAGPRRVLGDQDDDDQREQRQSDHPQHHLVREGAAHHLADQRASTCREETENKVAPASPGSSEAAFGERSCLRLFQASGSLGKSAARAALAGHTRLGFDIGPHG